MRCVYTKKGTELNMNNAYGSQKAATKNSSSRNSKVLLYATNTHTVYTSEAWEYDWLVYNIRGTENAWIFYLCRENFIGHTNKIHKTHVPNILQSTCIYLYIGSTYIHRVYMCVVHAHCTWCCHSFLLSGLILPYTSIFIDVHVNVVVSRNAVKYLWISGTWQMDIEFNIE